MSEFVLNIDDISYAIAHPFKGSKHPENAAYGRVAQSFIVDFVSKEVGIKFIEPTIAGIKKILPQANAGFISSDGPVIYCDGINQTYQIILEVKLDCGSGLTLSPNEFALMKMCLDKKISYFLGFAKLLDKKTFRCEYLGVIQMTEELAKHGPKYRITDLM